MKETSKVPSEWMLEYAEHDGVIAKEKDAPMEIKQRPRRGRPPLGDRAKGVVTIRLDADLLADYRSLGAGWQTRMNADLRRARKLKKLVPASR